MTTWSSIADDVWIRRYEEFDLSIGLIVGDSACLIVDTRGDADQGKELAAAVREITPHPWSLVYTHGHFDHVRGASAFGDGDIWAHRTCDAFMQRTAEHPVVSPNKLIDTTADVSIGGRKVRFIHPGSAHTDHDVIVHVPDANVVFVGDLVENGAPPQFGDGYPLQWPNALAEIIAMDAKVVAPGHGDPVDNAFVAEQRTEVLAIADLCRAVWAGEMSEDEAVAQSPYPPDFTRPALARSDTARTT